MFFRYFRPHRNDGFDTEDLDSFKGIFLNSTVLKSRIEQERMRVKRSEQSLSIVIISFKTLVTEMADISGSSVRNMLKYFGVTVMKVTRRYDIKGWLSDDKFAILTPDTDDIGAQALVDNLVNRLTEHQTLKASHLRDHLRNFFIIFSLEDHNIQFAISEGFYTPWSCSQVFNKTRSSLPDADMPSSLPSLSCPGGSATKGDPSFFFEIQDIMLLNVLHTLAKRAIDVIGSLIGLLLFSPIMLSIAVLIKVSSKGPILYRQERLGLGAKSFFIYKFRTMKDKNNDIIHKNHIRRLIKQDAADSDQQDVGFDFKLSRDDRITPIGKFLRKTSLDELPQFYNVLMGDMSLVGPRPHPKYECDLYKAWYWERLTEAKPGITGLWQVDGRIGITYDDQIRLDLAYVRNGNIWLDLKILIKTIWAVIFPKGAA